MAEAGSIVRVTDVTKVFKLGKIDVHALKGVDLERFGVIAFATHALVAEELDGVVEPSLVLKKNRDTRYSRLFNFHQLLRERQYKNLENKFNNKLVLLEG